MKELLLIGCGVMGYPYILAAHELGIRVRLLESPERIETLRESVDEGIPVDGEEQEHWVAATEAAIAQYRPDGVLAFTEVHVLAAALAQDKLGLPGPSLHAAVASRNKAIQRACCDAELISQPRYRHASSLSSEAFWASEHMPIVVKPLSEAGSVGVEFLNTQAELQEAIKRRVSPLLVEEAVHGPEYSWEGIVRDGEILFSTVTQKETTGAPQFVETGHWANHCFSETEQEKVQGFSSRVIRALRIRTSVVHLEFRMNSSEPTLMECAVRTPGDFIMDLVSEAHGFNMHEAVVRLAMGLPLNLPPASAVSSYAASWWITAPPGQVTNVEGLDTVRRLNGVIRANVKHERGAIIPALRSSADRVGHVVISAPTETERNELMSLVRSTLLVETKPV